jgi:hemerythrin-like domain-containing protein
MNIHRSDMEKVLDTVTHAAEHHVYRDRMNGSLHLAREVRFSPLTSELIAARERLEKLLAEVTEGVD